MCRVILTTTAFTHKNTNLLCNNMYIRMLGEILLSEFGYLVVALVVIGAIFCVTYLLFGDIISNDEDDDIDLWPQ